MFQTIWFRLALLLTSVLVTDSAHITPMKLLYSWKENTKYSNVTYIYYKNLTRVKKTQISNKNPRTPDKTEKSQI